jgi:hypothetical protein
MKKLLLLTTILMIAAIASAQDRVLLPKEKLNFKVKVSRDLPHPEVNQNLAPINYNIKSHAVAPNEHDIGITVFDSQTNKLLQNRIYRYEDGSIGAVWMLGMDDPDFDDRGTGYNFYDGTEWGPIPENRLESFRAGWPSYAPLGTDGEIVFCHDFAITKLYYLSREIKGIGDWSETVFSYISGPESLTWPRIITTGTDKNTIHLLANSYYEYMGQSRAMVYSRSQDGGLTWDIENTVLEGTGVNYYSFIGADEWVWADEKAGNIAFLCAAAWHDMFIMKSSDYGDTWEKTVIWEHPYPFFDYNTTITDTFYSMDKSAGIALDSEGKAHVVFGITRVIHDMPGNSYYIWKYTDGIGYWNEDMEPFSNDLDALAPPGYGYANSEMVVDYNYIGWMQDVNGNGTIDLNDDIFYYRQHGASTMPTITIDDQDQIFVIFSSTTETYEYEFINYKHLWARSFNNGLWQHFLDLSQDIAHLYDECIYPVLASSSDDYIHYIYNVDNIPGLAQRGHHDFIENKIIYGALPKSDLEAVEENNDIPGDHLNVQNFPNPSSGILTVRYRIEENSHVSLNVLNMTGEVVETSFSGEQKFGEHTVKLDLSHLPGGLYLIRLQAGERVETAKVVLLK